MRYNACVDGFSTSSLVQNNIQSRSFRYGHVSPRTSTRLHVFDRMSVDCIAAIVVAQEEAAKFESEEVTPAICLLGMLDRPEGAANTLKQFDITTRHAKIALKKIATDSNPLRNDSTSFANMFNLQAQARNADLPFSISLRKVFNQAAEEADNLGSPNIKSEHVILALIGDPIHPEVNGVLRRMPLTKDFTPTTFRSRLVANLTPSETAVKKELAIGESTTSMPTLKEIGVDLTALAKQRKLDDIYGRDKEISQALRTLSRRRKNNPW